MTEILGAKAPSFFFTMTFSSNARMAKVFFYLYFKIFGLIPQVFGHQGLKDEENGLIFLCNYSSPLDPGLLSISLPQPVSFLLTERFKKITFVSHVSERMGNLHFSSTKLSVSLLRDTKKLIRDKHHLVAFPDGQPSNDGFPQNIPAGTASLIFHAGTKFVPVAISGSRKVLKPGEWIPKVHPIRVLIGKPEPFPEFIPPPLRKDGRKVFAQYLSEKMNSLYDFLVHAPAKLPKNWPQERKKAEIILPPELGQSDETGV